MQEIFKGILAEVSRACEEVCCQGATVRAELSQGTPIQMFAKEFGHGKVSPVPFVRNVVEVKKDEWGKALSDSLRRQFRKPGKQKPADTIRRLEDAVYKDVKESAKAIGGFSQEEVDQMRLAIKVN